MDLHETLATLTRHTVFKSWHAKNKDYFLAHAFVMLDEANKDTWQIGFYSSEKNKIITFMLNKTSVTHTDEQEVLTSDVTISKLEPSQVTKTVDEALASAKKCYDANYKKEMAMKQFFIIQMIDSVATFNITYFTQSFKTINIKVNASSGEIISHSLQALADFA